MFLCPPLGKPINDENKNINVIFGFREFNFKKLWKIGGENVEENKSVRVLLL